MRLLAVRREDAENCTEALVFPPGSSDHEQRGWIHLTL